PKLFGSGRRSAGRLVGSMGRPSHDFPGGGPSPRIPSFAPATPVTPALLTERLSVHLRSASLRLLIAVVALPLALGAAAQGKKRVDKAADLPVFSYKVEGKLEALIRDDTKFRAFARELRRDTESVLAQ